MESLLASLAPLAVFMVGTWCAIRRNERRM